MILQFHTFFSLELCGSKLVQRLKSNIIVKRQILWPLDGKSRLIGKDPDVEKA